MQDLIDFVTTKEVLMVLGGLGIVLIIYLITCFVHLAKRHKERVALRHNTIELNKLVDDVAALKEEQLPKVFQRNIEESAIKVDKPKEVETILPITEVASSNMVSVKAEESESSVVVERGFTTPIEIEPKIVMKNPWKVEENRDNVQFSSMYDSPVEILDTEEPSKIEILEETPLEYKEEVYTKEEAKEELERLTEELKKQEEMNIRLTEFEEKQEEDAIISLQELMEKGKQLTAINEQTQYQDEGNEPISLEELEQRYQMEQPKQSQELVSKSYPTTEAVESIELDDFQTVKVEPYQSSTIYKPTPIISPIFGIEEESIAKEDALELENTANFAKLDEEIRKTNEFLSQLKELQRKLD